jgi:hypothetical protein
MLGEMKWTSLVLVIALVQTGFAGYCQITLKEKNAPLEKVLVAIEKQTKYVFLYDPDELRTVTITIDIKNATLRTTLEKCFKDLPIEFIIIGNNILLKRTPGKQKLIFPILTGELAYNHVI